MSEALRPIRDELFDWILSLGPKAKYNLTSSGLPEPDLHGMGIDTSFERFAGDKGEHEKAFAEEVARLYGVDHSNVVLTNGSSEAIFLAYAVLGDRGRAVVPCPNYPAMSTVPRSLGMKVGHSLGRSRDRRTVVGLTDPNNPTGKSLDDGTVEALIDSAARTGGTVYINETYGEFTFSGAPQTHFGGNGNVVTSSTMTKFYGLGRLRVGWILADERRARQILFAKWAVSGHDSEYSLWIATQVLRRREEFVNRAKQVVARNAPLVRNFVEMTKGVTAELGAAPFCLVHYSRGGASVPLSRSLMAKAGVLVSPGDFFGAPRSFRLCFTADEETLRGGLGALSDFFNRL